MKKPSSERLVTALLSGKMGKKYQGKQVMVVGNEISIVPTSKVEAERLFKKLDKKSPGQTPTIVYVPHAETYILICK